MRNEDKDYFTLVWDIITAIERKEYVVGEAPDCPTEDKTAFVLPQLGFSTPEDRFVCPCELVSTLFLNQMSLAERHQIPERFTFASTRHDGGAMFFFRMPEDKVFDFAAIKKNFENIREMFRPMSLAEINLGPYRDNPHQVCVGPLDERDMNFFTNLTESMGRFHGVPNIDVPMVPTDVGLFIVFEKGLYAQLLKNTEMLMSCPVYRGDTSLPSAPAVP
jgi:hypothetical protein